MATAFTPRLSKGVNISKKVTCAHESGNVGNVIIALSDSAKTYATEAAEAERIAVKLVHPNKKAKNLL